MIIFRQYVPLLLAVQDSQLVSVNIFQFRNENGKVFVENLDLRDRGTLTRQTFLSWATTEGVILKCERLPEPALK